MLFSTTSICGISFLLLIKAIISSASNSEKLSDEVDDEAIVGN